MCGFVVYWILNECDNSKNRLVEVQSKNGKWTPCTIAMPDLGTMGVLAIDADQSGDYFITLSDYL